MKTFRGTYTVMITPFTPAGEVDAEALRDFVDWQIGQGIHGLIPLGSTGEFLSLDDDEKILVAETVIAQAAGFNASIGLKTTGNKQAIAMKADSQFRAANISLSK